MSAKAAIEFQGPSLDELQRALVATFDKVQDKQGLMEEIAQALVSSTTARFRAETAPDGNRWEPSIRAQETGDLTLTDRGILRGSITYALGTRRIEVGSNESYAGVHQDGFDGVVAIAAHTRRMVSAFGKPLKQPKTVNVRSFKRKMSLVARPYLGLSAADKDEIRAILKRRSQQELNNVR